MVILLAIWQTSTRRFVRIPYSITLTLTPLYLLSHCQKTESAFAIFLFHPTAHGLQSNPPSTWILDAVHDQHLDLWVSFYLFW